MVILFDLVYNLYLSMPLPIETIYSNFKFNTETTWIMPMNLLKYPNFKRADKYTLSIHPVKNLIIYSFFFLTSSKETLTLKKWNCSFKIFFLNFTKAQKWKFLEAVSSLLLTIILRWKLSKKKNWLWIIGWGTMTWKWVRKFG